MVVECNFNLTAARAILKTMLATIERQRGTGLAEGDALVVRALIERTLTVL